MTLILYALLGLAGLGLAVFLVWGLLSRRHAIPCPAWLGWLVELDNPFTRTNRAAEIISHLELRPGMTVLDAGCGPGRLTLGEIPDREAALQELFDALKPGGVLSITEVMFDPHFRRRSTVSELAVTAGFREKAFHGSRIAYTIHFEKPTQLTGSQAA